MDFDVFVVCRERLIAEAITEAIRSIQGFKKFGFSTNLNIDKSEGYCGCFLVDYELIEPSFESIYKLKANFPGCRIVVLGDTALSYALRMKGITSVIEFSASIDELKGSLLKIIRGNPIPSSVKRPHKNEPEDNHRSRFDALSAQETKILDFLVQGLRPGEVADELSIKPQSVSSAIKRMCDKVVVKDRMELCFMRIRENR